MVMGENSVIMQNIWFPRTKEGWFDTRIFEIPKMYEERGWHMIDPHPWDKINAPPAGNHKRYDHNEFEFIFTFANGPDYVYHKYRRPYRSKTRSKAASGNMRKPGISGTHAGGHADLNPKGAAQSNIYRFSPTGGREVKRPRIDDGVFPMALARRAILQYSNPGDTIVDPFFGSGTTVVEAVLNGRNAVGYDTNYRNVDIAIEWLRELGF
jgi:DNA modification methylase